MVGRVILSLFLIFGLGCGASPSRIGKPVFDSLYDQIDPAPEQAEKFLSVPLVTLAAVDMPLPQFCRAVAAQTGISIISEISLDKQSVTAQVSEQPIDVVLSSIARRLGVQVVSRGNLYYIGALKPEDRGQLVRRVSRLTRDQLDSAAKLMLSDVGRAWSAPDGLVVISDRVEVLARIDEMLRSIEQSQPGTWVVQFYLVSLSDQAQHDLGIDVSHAVSVGANVLRGSASASHHVISGKLDALLVAARASSSSRVVAQPMFLVQDGQTARVQEGEVIPVPRRTVGETGVVTVTGYDRIETGMLLTTLLRKQGESEAQLTLDMTLSQVTGFVGEVPITQQSAFSTVASITRNGTFLLGQILRDKIGKSNSGPLVPLRWKWDTGASVVQLWARVYCVR